MNIFEYAMEIEKEGEKFYREIAAKTDHPGVRSILNLLAEDEVKHYLTFHSMKGGKDVEMADTRVLSEAKSVFSKLTGGPDQFAGLPEKELLAKAQQLEKKSEEFYRDKARESEEENTRAILERIAGEELKHYWLLDNMIAFLSRPENWLENAEWNHLEKY